LSFRFKKAIKEFDIPNKRARFVELESQPKSLRFDLDGDDSRNKPNFKKKQNSQD